MHRQINFYNLMSLMDFELEQLMKDYGVPPICYITSSGHGWNTGGKRSFDGTLRENQFNSIVEGKISMLCHALREKGLNLVKFELATEHNDVPLWKRCEREHEIFDAHENTHLVLGHAIHADAFTKPTANGTTTFHFKGSDAYYWGETMQDSLIKAHQLRNRGVKTANYKILRDTKAPWILTEAGFMTHPREKELLKSDGFRNKHAIASVNAMLETAVLHHDKFGSWE